jgi:hypothetical protein
VVVATLPTIPNLLRLEDDDTALDYGERYVFRRYAARIVCDKAELRHQATSALVSK